MIKIENNNPPRATENTEKAIKRLEKIERVAQKIKIHSVVAPIAVGVCAGLCFGYAGMGMGGFAGVIAAPALAAVPVAIENLAHLRAGSLRKRMPSLSTQELLEEEQKKTKKLEDDYANKLKSYGSDSLAPERKGIEFQKNREDIFRQATALAKQNNEEKTVQRLMHLAAKAKQSKTIKHGVNTGIGGVMSIIALSISAKMHHANMIYEEALANYNFSIAEAQNLRQLPYYSENTAVALGIIGTVVAAATLTCAARTVQSHKEQKTANEALDTLKKYVGRN